MNTVAEERKSLWWLMPIVLLGGLISLLLAMIFVATHDDGFAVEPDYYKKATNWDETMRERAASARLGWSSPATLTAATQGSRLSIELSDAEGKPIAGAHVEVDAFANARAANIEHAALDEAAAGRYQTTLKSQRPGLWEVRIRATGTGGEHYVDTQRIDLVGGPR